MVNKPKRGGEKNRPPEISRKGFAQELLSREKERIRLNEVGYAKKYGETFKNSLTKAREGKKDRIFQLIAWDKSFLAEPYILDQIIKAEERNDKKFLKAIAAAVNRTGKTKARKHGALINILRKAVEKGWCKNEKDLITYCNEMEESASQEWNFSDKDPTLNLLRDIKELPRFVKRNKHLIFR